MAYEPYTYCSLSTPTSFRIISVVPQPTGQVPFTISLLETSFENDVSFRAVSYTWDGQCPDSTIICDGKQLDVTLNVLKILSIVALDVEEGECLLWVDSICIDQSSTSDKNHQVPQMGKIYSRASSVLIWLGEGTYETDIAFDFLNGIANTDAELKDIENEKGCRLGSGLSRRIRGLPPG